MPKETDLDELSILKSGYERFIGSPGELGNCENAIITVRRQQQITTHFGPLTTKNKIKVSLSQEQIINQANRYHPNIKRSQSTNIQKSLISPGVLANRANSIRPSLIPVKIKDQPNLRAITLTPNQDQSSMDNPKYRSVRKLSAPFGRRNYVSQQEATLSSLPTPMTQSMDPNYSKYHDVHVELLDRYKCEICLNILSDSRVLNCLHTFCLECLYSIECTNQCKTTPNKLTPTFRSNSFESGKPDMSSSNCSDESKESDRKMSKSSIGSSKPIRRAYSVTAKKRPDELKQKSMSTQSTKRPLSSITEKSKITLKCPICGQRTEIPIGGVCRVPKNFLLERQLQDEIQKLQTQCLNDEYCSQCYDQIVAIAYCLNCEINLCDLCQEAHVRQRWTSKHNVITLPDFKSASKRVELRREQQQGSNSNVSIKCFIHPKHDLKLYCINCNQVACHNCTILLHKGHKFESIEKAKQHVIDDFKRSLERNQRFYQYINESISKLAASISKINDRADIVQMEVEIFLKDYFEALDAHKESLLRQISKAKEMKSFTILEQEEFLQKQAHESKQVNYFAENLLQNGTDIEILTFIGVLQHRFEFCQKSKIPPEPSIADSLAFLRDVQAPAAPYQNNIPVFGVLATQDIDSN